MGLPRMTFYAEGSDAICSVCERDDIKLSSPPEARQIFDKKKGKYLNVQLCPDCLRQMPDNEKSEKIRAKLKVLDSEPEVSTSSEL
jgi:hypothetical protein